MKALLKFLGILLIFLGLLFVAVGSFGLCLDAYDQPETVIAYGWGSKSDTSAHSFHLSDEECAKQPQWAPDQELPVSMETLRQSAFRHTFGSDEASWKAWKITRVKFQRMRYSGGPRHRERENRWVCLFELTQADPLPPKHCAVCVLLDGTYVEPRPRSLFSVLD